MKKSLSISVALTYLLCVAANAVVLSNARDYWPDDRYIDHGDNTITDTVTGLMWQKCMEGKSGTDCTTGEFVTTDWETALSTANNSTLAGCTDWRLPTITELSSLLALNRYEPAANEVAFPGLESRKLTWTSSPRSLSSLASTEVYVIDLYRGADDFEGIAIDNGSSTIRLVRDARPEICTI